MIRYRTAAVGNHQIFYREAGDRNQTSLLLLHGFPSSSHMFRNLIPLLADRFHLVAPDFPGFGFSQSPPRAQFAYTFDNLAKVIESFTEVIGLTYYAIYVFERVRVGDVAGFTAKIVQDVLHRHGDDAAKRFCGLPCHTRC